MDTALLCRSFRNVHVRRNALANFTVLAAYFFFYLNRFDFFATDLVFDSFVFDGLVFDNFIFSNLATGFCRTSDFANHPEEIVRFPFYKREKFLDILPTTVEARDELVPCRLVEFRRKRER